MDIVVALLQYYSFDLGDRTLNELLQDWSDYDSTWVRLAIVESLYQGRYKAVSVNQILTFWQRKGEPHCRFNHEFERLVCGDFVFSLPKVSRYITQPKINSAKVIQLPTRTKPSTKPTTTETFKPTVADINLLSEGSLFVDKLRSIYHHCSESEATAELVPEDRDLAEISTVNSSTEQQNLQST